MKPFQISDRIGRLPGYPLARIPTIKRRLLEAGVDVIDLGAGDIDTLPDRRIIESLDEALEQVGNHRYGFQQGLPAFRQAASRWVERRFGQHFDPMTELLPLIGSKEGLSHLTMAVCNPGDVAVIPEPGYQSYIGGAILADCEPVIVPLRPESDFLVDLERLDPSVLARTRLVYVNYPNNPTAAIAPREYLERLVATCRKHGIVLAYDNAYCDITFDGYVAPSIFEIDGARDVAIEFFSLSKSFRMTGWRLGFAVGRPELVRALTQVKSYVDTGPFLAVQHAGAWTLDHAEELLRPVVAELVERRDAGVDALSAAGFSVDTPLAAMYLWVPLPPGIASADFATRALETEGVVLLPGSGFGPGGEGFFRIALTEPPDRIREAVTRLGISLDACRSGVGSAVA